MLKWPVVQDLLNATLLFRKLTYMEKEEYLWMNILRFSPPTTFSAYDFINT